MRTGRLAAAGLALALGLGGCASLGGGASGASYTDDRGPIQMVSTMVGTKNVFIPSTVVVSEGAGRKLTIFNTTDIPHGFSIMGLGVETILQPGVETEVQLPELQGGHIYEIGCQLHAPHRHATLVVVHER
jgi:hypothetical protein